MTPGQIDAFLAEPRMAHFVTIGGDGRARVRPVWYLWRDGVFWVTTPTLLPNGNLVFGNCHAGPETPDYREFLDPEYREKFDESLIERQRLIAANKLASPISMGGDEAFQEEWFGHEEGEESLHVGGLRCGWDAPQRDKELDNDGVTAEVIFPGPDAATGSMGSRSFSSKRAS